MARGDNGGVLGWPGDTVLSPQKREKIQGGWEENSRTTDKYILQSQLQIEKKNPSCDFYKGKKKGRIQRRSEMNEKGVQKCDEEKHDLSMIKENYNFIK